MLALSWVRKVIFVVMVIPPIFLGSVLKRDAKASNIPPKRRLGNFIHILAGAILACLFIGDSLATEENMLIYYIMLGVAGGLFVIAFVLFFVFTPRFTERK